MGAMKVELLQAIAPPKSKQMHMQNLGVAELVACLLAVPRVRCSNPVTYLKKVSFKFSLCAC
jgi:hypothetical protein